MIAPHHFKPGSNGARSATLGVVALFFLPVAASRGLELNAVVPDIAAPDLNGKMRGPDEFAGRATLVLFWQPDHPRSRAALCDAARITAEFPDTPLVTIVPGRFERAEIVAASESCTQRPLVLLDPERNLFGAFQIVALPTLMIAGPDRRLRYKTAGFSADGLASARALLDEMHGRRSTEVTTIAADPSTLRRFGMAQQLLKAGAHAQAEGILESLTKSHPEFRPAWVSLGYRRVAGGRAEEAKASFEKALELDAKPTDIAAGMAWVFWKKGDTAQSARWAAAADEKDANFALVRQIRAAGGDDGRER